MEAEARLVLLGEGDAARGVDREKCEGGEECWLGAGLGSVCTGNMNSTGLKEGERQTQRQTREHFDDIQSNSGAKYRHKTPQQRHTPTEKMN